VSARPLRAALLAWYRERRRDLPWRRTRDPYAIWVSEIMLQQTRVETVVPYYGRFLERFPTVRALAIAREDDVLAAWSGLGYYRRARGLHAAAAIVARDHAGSLPDDRDSLRALPGIGDYTAAAIQSIAFGRVAAAVDGNVVRVLARIHGLSGRRDSPGLKRDVTALAETLARGPAPGDWTQALMELGATVCLPRDPRCGECPVASRCVARRSGDPARYPEPAVKQEPRSGREVLLLARRGRSVYLEEDATPTGRAWTLPRVRARASKGVAPPSGPPAAARTVPPAAARAVAARHGLSLEPGTLLAAFRHRTYADDLSIEVWAAAPGPGTARRSGGRWVTPAGLKRLPLRAPTLKALHRLRAKGALP
jgi:A/G-specific adenine glycosylase